MAGIRGAGTRRQHAQSSPPVVDETLGSEAIDRDGDDEGQCFPSRLVKDFVKGFDPTNTDPLVTAWPRGLLGRVALREADG